MTYADDYRSLYDAILAGLTAEMENRGSDPAVWIPLERIAVVRATNDWVDGHGTGRAITGADVKRIENRATGFIDYATKLALYVADYALPRTPPTTNPENP